MKTKKQLVEWAVEMQFFPNVTAARKESVENLRLAYDGYMAQVQEQLVVDTYTPGGSGESMATRMEKLVAKAKITGVPFADKVRRQAAKTLRKLLASEPSSVPLDQRLASLLNG